MWRRHAACPSPGVARQDAALPPAELRLTSTTGKDAMAKSSPSDFGSDYVHQHTRNPIAGLWQMPLLVVSLGLFSLAAYLLLDPTPAPRVAEELAKAHREVRQERYDAAVERLNELAALPLPPEQNVETHLLTAKALDESMRRSRRAETPATHRRVLQEIRTAFEEGAKDTPDVADREARSWEYLGGVDKAASRWRTAARMATELGEPALAVPMRRSAAEMLIHHGRPAAAAQELRDLLLTDGLADDEKAWALGELARLRIDAERPDEAMPLLAEALALSPDDRIRGQVNFRLGYAAFKLGNRDEAQSYLLEARRQLGTGHSLDAEASYLLGQIAQAGLTSPDADVAQAAAREASGYYEVVLRDHPSSRTAPRARMGRAVSRLVLGDANGGADDLRRAATKVADRPNLAPLRDDLIESLRRAGSVLVANGDHARDEEQATTAYELAIEMMALEQQATSAAGRSVDAEFYARLARGFERRGDLMYPSDLNRQAIAENKELREQVEAARSLWVHAGDAHVARSRALTLVDDAAYGEALWQGVRLYERAADMYEIIAALDLFVRERPNDPIAPEALLRLGRAYQAAGQQSEASVTFVELRDDHPQTLAAAEAAVPLAQVYVSQGRDRWHLAENTLRSVLEDNPVLGPESRVFQSATWELGSLYYRMGRWGEALSRYEEYAERYGESTQVPTARLLFLRADCYRRAAGDLAETASDARVEAQVAAASSPDGRRAGTSASARREAAASADRRLRYLQEAKRLFEAAVTAYAATPTADDAADRDLATTYERLAWFYRADCLYDLGEYAAAVELYEQAAFRYQDDPSSLSAYVQIVNSYVALGRPEDARTANERAKWLLRRIPPEQFRDGSVALNRQQWQDWLDWSGETGLF